MSVNYRNQLTEIIRFARDMYFSKNIKMSKGKKVWNITNVE